MNVSLVLFKEDGDQRVFDLDPGKTIIGRQEDCDLRIPLSEVSRHHAVLIISEDNITIRDSGSSNGTYVNNQKVTEHELEAGDHLVVGPVVFTVQIDGEPQDIKPVQTRLQSRASLTQTAAAMGEHTEEVDEEDFLLDGEEDPISELEALAASDETAALDMDDSGLELQPDDDEPST